MQLACARFNMGGSIVVFVSFWSFVFVFGFLVLLFFFVFCFFDCFGFSLCYFCLFFLFCMANLATEWDKERKFLFSHPRGSGKTTTMTIASFVPMRFLYIVFFYFFVFFTNIIFYFLLFVLIGFVFFVICFYIFLKYFLFPNNIIFLFFIFFKRFWLFLFSFKIEGERFLPLQEVPIMQTCEVLPRALPKSALEIISARVFS